MTDFHFRSFMYKIVQSIEPYEIPKGTEIVAEMHDVGEITFIIDGIVGIGYEINKIKRIPLLMKNRCVIGAYYIEVR